MTLIKLDRTGHTELDLSPEEMVKELEQEMNSGRKVVIAEQPGQEPVYLRKAEQAKDLSPQARVTVAPQLMGG